MATMTWHDRELLTLEAVNDGYEAGELVENAEQLADLTGLDVDETKRTLKALWEADYIEGSPSEPMGGGRFTFDLIVMRPTERARREIGQWPTDSPYDELVVLLEQRIAETSDPDQESQLVRFRDGLLGMSREVATSLLTALIRSQVSLG